MLTTTDSSTLEGAVCAHPLADPKTTDVCNNHRVLHMPPYYLIIREVCYKSHVRGDKSSTKPPRVVRLGGLVSNIQNDQIIFGSLQLADSRAEAVGHVYGRHLSVLAYWSSA